MSDIDIEEEARQRYNLASDLIIQYQELERKLNELPKHSYLKRLQILNKMENVDKQIQIIKKLVK